MPEVIKKLKIKHVVLIYFFFVFTALCLSGFMGSLNSSEKYIDFLEFILVHLIAILFAKLIYEKSNQKINLNFSFRGLKLFPIMAFLPMFLMFGFTAQILEYIPLSENEKQRFYELGNDQSIQTLVSIIILAPIFEEILSRGIILKGLLESYSPIVAILVSSLFFGLLHFNLGQLIGAFGFGLISGWVFWKTESIILSILLHVFNNLFFTIFGMYYGLEYLIETPIRYVFGSLINQVLVISFCIVSFGLLIKILNNKFEKLKTE